MSAATIAKQMHGRGAGAGRYLCRCPVPSHGRGKGDRNPSLIVSDAPDSRDGVHVHCLAGCDWRDVKAELGRLYLIAGRPLPPRAAKPAKRPDCDQSRRNAKLAATIWNEARP